MIEDHRTRGAHHGYRAALVGTVAGIVALGGAGSAWATGLPPVPPTSVAPTAPTAPPAPNAPGGPRPPAVVGTAVDGLPASGTGTASEARSRAAVLAAGAAPFPRASSAITAVFV